MINKEIAHILNQIGDLLELDEANPFRIRAYRRGAETLINISDDLAHMEKKEILAIPGIGQGIAALIEEYKIRKKVNELDTLKKKYPQGVLDIMNLPGLGASRARVLFKKLKINTVEKLRTAAEKDKLTKLSGFGAKMQDAIIKNISFAEEASKRILLSDALEMRQDIKTYLKKSPAIQNCESAGSLRRWKETIGDLDFLCTSKQPQKAIQHFISFGEVKEVLAAGKTKASIVLNSGFQCDFRVVEEKSFGAALMYFTGSKEHNVRLRELALKKGLTLNEYGLFRLSDKKRTKPVASRTEEEVYKRLGLPWIPPELREDRGEVEAGLKKKLPRLITEKDIKGDFHNHTDMSDGEDTLEDMIKTAQKKKWSWFYSADHSPSLTIANGLSVQRLRTKMKSIEKWNKRLKNFHVKCSSEVDILVNGKLDYPDAILKDLDCVVASVHSRFKQTEQEMTDRICQALKNPYVDILGHLSGRLLNRREPYQLNFEAVFETAQKTQTAIEINGQSQRQELQDFHIKKAIEMGVPLVLNTDAHSTDQLDNMTIAVHIARRGWAEPKHILNTLSAKDIERWLNR